MNQSYRHSRALIETYFDRTASDAWSRLTSDAPVSRIRKSVRAGRERMRHTLLNWLPADLSGKTILDAGCGTGAFAQDAARRGAHVIAIDLSPTLVSIARQRVPRHVGQGSIRFLSGDMLDPDLGEVDHVIAMDSLIHYRAEDAVDALTKLCARARASVLFTFAPKTLPLTLMHHVGQFFPRADRSPAIVPVAEPTLQKLLQPVAASGWALGRSERIQAAFYTSQATELTRQ